MPDFCSYPEKIVGDSSDSVYAGREQTAVKHFILRNYLQRFAYKIGSAWDVITYVDCFSGPWQSQSDDLEDTSFAIALHELRNARDEYLKRGRHLALRCLFLERNREAFAKLREYASRQKDVSVLPINSEFESAIPEIIQFVREGGTSSFPFIFIDPTGWTGFAMSTIAPLLQLHPVEVLINFMTGHIQRFLKSPEKQTQRSFERLFGSAEYQSVLAGLEGPDREDAAVALYSESIKRVGKFTHTSTAIVLNPKRNRTHFHLIYATRHAKGVEVFKDAERKAMEVMETARAGARQRQRTQRPGATGELFAAPILYDQRYFESLRKRYRAKARGALEKTLRTKKRVPYDDVWAEVMRFPLVWEPDLREWIEGWKGAGLEAPLQPRQRKLRRGAGNILTWVKPVN